MNKNFDIEHFPTTETAKRMISRVSPIYDRSYVGKWLFEIMGFEMEEARILVKSLRDQCWLESCTWGMRYWEERYGIEVDETKDLEARRAAVIAKRGKKRPLSPAAFEEVLKTLTGRDVTIDENEHPCSFTVQIEEGPSPVDYIAIIEKIDAMKPSHLSYSIELPRKKEANLYFAAVMHEMQNIEFTEYNRKSFEAITWIVDESGNTLVDEKMNVIVD